MNDDRGGRARRRDARDGAAQHPDRERSRLPRNEFDEAVDRFVDQAREMLLRTAGQVLDQASDAMGRPGARSAQAGESGAKGEGDAAGASRRRHGVDPELRRQAEPLFSELESEIKRLKLAARDLHDGHRSGFDRKLMRNPHRARIGGVCAGLADYFQRETWFIRIAVVTGAVFFPGIVIPAYVVAYFLLDSAPQHGDEAEGSQRSYRARSAQRSRPHAEDARVVMRAARGRVQAAEKRLQQLEGYVTSPRYLLDRELGTGRSDRAASDEARAPLAARQEVGGR